MVLPIFVRRKRLGGCSLKNLRKAELPMLKRNTDGHVTDQQSKNNLGQTECLLRFTH